MNSYPIVAFEARVYVGDLDNGRTQTPYFYLHASPPFLGAVSRAIRARKHSFASVTEVPVVIDAPSPDDASCTMLQRLHLASATQRQGFIVLPDGIPEPGGYVERVHRVAESTLVIENDGQALLRVRNGFDRDDDGVVRPRNIVTPFFWLDDLLCTVASANALKEAA